MLIKRDVKRRPCRPERPEIGRPGRSGRRNARSFNFSFENFHTEIDSSRWLLTRALHVGSLFDCGYPGSTLLLLRINEMV